MSVRQAEEKSSSSEDELEVFRGAPVAKPTLSKKTLGVAPGCSEVRNSSFKPGHSGVNIDKFFQGISPLAVSEKRRKKERVLYSASCPATSGVAASKELEDGRLRMPSILESASQSSSLDCTQHDEADWVTQRPAKKKFGAVYGQKRCVLKPTRADVLFREVFGSPSVGLRANYAWSSDVKDEQVQERNGKGESDLVLKEEYAKQDGCCKENVDLNEFSKSEKPRTQKIATSTPAHECFFRNDSPALSCIKMPTPNTSEFGIGCPERFVDSREIVEANSLQSLLEQRSASDKKSSLLASASSHCIYSNSGRSARQEISRSRSEGCLAAKVIGSGERKLEKIIVGDLGASSFGFLLSSD